ncbi:hypothetical protein ACEWK1_01825 [Metabacillus sp. YM-086]|uniref:hypothetical protein n=1 Tax=Metabacillus sp. YM-086 TaxID=3341729 RepID=UPI003A840AEE
MDNEIADHLSKMFEESELTNLKVTDQSETTKRSDNDFQTHITILAGVASSITESQRARAEGDFRKWIYESAKSQTMYLLAVEGTKKSN